MPGYGPNRLTIYYYDWRDRQVASDNGVTITFNTLDNLGEVIQSNIYSDRYGSNQGTSVGAPNSGAPTAPAAGALRAQTINDYDNNGQIFSTTSAENGALKTGQL